MSRKTTISSFEEARRTLKNIFMNHTSWKSRPCIVDTRTKSLKEEITYKELLKDLYISFLEDEEDKSDSYWSQVEKFEDWYSSLKPGQDHFLVEKLILRPEYSQKTEEEAKELVEIYFLGITRKSLNLSS